jgi:hypothetical protein
MSGCSRPHASEDTSTFYSAPSGATSIAPPEGRASHRQHVVAASGADNCDRAYSLDDDGKHRPYGMMVLQIEGDRISGIDGFPDPWLSNDAGYRQS